MMETSTKVLILDFGSQYTQLIARRIRSLQIYCEIHPYDLSLEKIQEFQPAALILSGGPASVWHDAAKLVPDPRVFDLPCPILGICYGQQLLAQHFGGEVEPAVNREYGRAEVYPYSLEAQEKGTRPQAPVAPGVILLQEFAKSLSKQETERGELSSFTVWMSHGDSIKSLPPDFVALAYTANTPYAVIAHRQKPLIGLQFHPEVAHTPAGAALLKAFLCKVAGLKPSWSMGSFLTTQIATLRAQVKADELVLCALSGGVDSAVVAALLGKAFREQLLCIFVDNGLLRAGEKERIEQIFKQEQRLPVHIVEAEDIFLTALAGVEDPEQKRKIIGAKFIEVFEAAARQHLNSEQLAGRVWLAQGTLYPDVIESVSSKGPSATIKSHHNVGGLPEKMALKLLEPLRELFKDEVRLLGLELGLSPEICNRQPFPGPGLAVRIIGEVTKERVALVRAADYIVEQEIRKSGYYERSWQSFAVLLPVKSVGVMGDERTYAEVLALRVVDSQDGMTADWSRLPYELLAQISNRLSNEIKGVSRVVYDISSKPPATIEWE